MSLRIFNKSLSSLIILQWFQYIAALILMPHLIGSLGLDSYGNVLLAQAWTAILIVLVEYGFSVYGVSEMGKVNGELKKSRYIFWHITIARLFIFLLTYLAILILYYFNFFSESFGYIFLVISISGLGAALSGHWYFLATQKANLIVKYSVLIKTSLLLSNFVFVTNSDDLHIALILYVLSYLLPGVYTLYVAVVFEKMGQPVVRIKEAILLFNRATPFLFARVANIGINQITLIISGFIFQAASVTILAVAIRVIQVCTMVYAPIQQHLLAKMSNKFSLVDVKAYLLACTLISICQIVIFYFLLPYISIFVLDVRDEQFIDIGNYSSIIFPLSVIYMLLGAPLMVSIGKNKEFNQSVILGFIMHLIILGVVYFAFEFGYSITLTLYAILALPFSKFCSLLIRFSYLFSIRKENVYRV